MVINEIKDFLNSYFDVLQDQDLAKFDRVFHASCVLYSAQDGVLVVRPLEEYRRVVQNRDSPQSLDKPRLDEILMIDVLSPEMALAKVRLRLFDNTMVDYLNLMKVNGQWAIFSKFFHRAA